MKDLKKIIKAEIDALKGIPIDNSIDKACNLIHNQVHLIGSKVVISGMGKAGHVGYNIAMTLSSTGTPAVYLHPSEAQHGDLGILQDHDILILISNSGKTREILELIELVKNMKYGNKIIAITGDPDSVLAQDSDITILTGNPKEVCPLELAPTCSTTVMTVIGDALVVKMMNLIHFTKEEYAKRHHGGYLGQKAKE